MRRPTCYSYCVYESAFSPPPTTRARSAGATPKITRRPHQCFAEDIRWPRRWRWRQGWRWRWRWPWRRQPGIRRSTTPQRPCCAKRAMRGRRKRRAGLKATLERCGNSAVRWAEACRAQRCHVDSAVAAVGSPAHGVMSSREHPDQHENNGSYAAPRRALASCKRIQ